MYYTTDHDMNSQMLLFMTFKTTLYILKELKNFKIIVSFLFFYNTLILFLYMIYSDIKYH